MLRRMICWTALALSFALSFTMATTAQAATLAKWQNDLTPIWRPVGFVVHQIGQRLDVLKRKLLAACNSHACANKRHDG